MPITYNGIKQKKKIFLKPSLIKILILLSNILQNIFLCVQETEERNSYRVETT